MKASIVRIGNSQGIRIPKPILEQIGLKDEVELEIVNGSIVLSKIQNPRDGWEESFSMMRERGDDKLVIQEIPNSWDEEEWTWE